MTQNALTTEKFIEKAKKIHSDKYDYTKTEYVALSKNVCIVCPEHGEFWQRADVHLRGSGCPLCSKRRKTISSLSDLVKKARDVHGDKYDYSKVDLTNVHNVQKDKIQIICPEHGEFWQTATIHLRGCGCPLCGIEKSHKNRLPSKYNTNWFINKARSIQGNRYNYAKSEYVNNKTKICIICPEHGEFWQMPSNHFSGNGCPICHKINKPIKAKEKYNTDWFVRKAREVHGDKYDYSKTNYVDSKTPVCITCPEHGDFMQVPNQHIFGYKCIKCAREELRTSKEEFILRAREIHGWKYDYSKVEYVNNHTEICIICPEHGEFWQKPVKHLNGGHGCPICKESNLEKDMRKFLDDNHIKYERQKKFEWLRNLLPLSIDFYLPDTNIAIECQGAQHFKSFEFFGGDDGYANIVERDTIKRKLCEEHGIKILYFADDDVDTSSYDDIECTVYTNTQELLTEIYNHKVNRTT